MKILGSSPSCPPVFNSPLLFSFLPKLCKSSHRSPARATSLALSQGAEGDRFRRYALGMIETSQPTSNVAWGETDKP